MYYSTYNDLKIGKSAYCKRTQKRPIVVLYCKIIRCYRPRRTVTAYFYPRIHYAYIQAKTFSESQDFYLTQIYLTSIKSDL